MTEDKNKSMAKPSTLAYMYMYNVYIHRHSNRIQNNLGVPISHAFIYIGTVAFRYDMTSWFSNHDATNLTCTELSNFEKNSTVSTIFYKMKVSTEQKKQQRFACLSDAGKKSGYRDSVLWSLQKHRQSHSPAIGKLAHA